MNKDQRYRIRSIIRNKLAEYLFQCFGDSDESLFKSLLTLSLRSRGEHTPNQSPLVALIKQYSTEEELLKLGAMNSAEDEHTLLRLYLDSHSFVLDKLTNIFKQEKSADLDFKYTAHHQKILAKIERARIILGKMAESDSIKIALEEIEFIGKDNSTVSIGSDIIFTGHTSSENGQIISNGTAEFMNGAIYEGEFLNGKLIKGRVTNDTSLNDTRIVYDGEFANGLPNGNGVLRDENGTALFEGFFLNGTLHNGIINRTYEDGRRVKGGILNGVFTGKGMTEKNGSIEDGEFKNGRMVKGLSISVEKEESVITFCQSAEDAYDAINPISNGFNISINKDGYIGNYVGVIPVPYNHKRTLGFLDKVKALPLEDETRDKLNRLAKFVEIYGAKGSGSTLGNAASIF